MKSRLPNPKPLAAPRRDTARACALAAALAPTFAAFAMLILSSEPAPAAADAKNPAAKTANAKTAPATRKSATAPTAVTETNAPAAPQIPRSVFLLSSPTQTLKDPFFPNSTRLSAAVASKNAGQKKDAPAAELALKAIFGTPARPFATINSTTLGPGEEQDVLTGAGRVRVRCLEINLAAQSVVVEVAGSRRELRFATAK